MTEDKRPSVTERRVSQNRLFRTAFGTSLLIHVLIFFFWRVVPIPASPFSAAGPRAGDFYAAGGGMESVSLRVPPARVIVPPRVPLISLEDIPVEFDMEPQLDLAAMTGEAPGTSEGPPGIEGGRGRGDGGTAEQGFFRVIPPSPRGLILPLSEDLKGKSLEVWVFVDATGKVVPDSTRLDPPTSSGSLNRQLIREAAEWVFNPALRNGEPVASWYPYRVSG